MTITPHQPLRVTGRREVPVRYHDFIAMPHLHENFQEFRRQDGWNTFEHVLLF